MIEFGIDSFAVTLAPPAGDGAVAPRGWLRNLLADTDQQAADEFYPGWAHSLTEIGRERGWRPAPAPNTMPPRARPAPM